MQKTNAMDLIKNLFLKIAELPTIAIVAPVILVIMILLVYAFFVSQEPKKKKQKLISAREIEEDIYERGFVEKKLRETAGNLSDGRHAVLLKKIELAELEKEKVNLN